MKKSVMEKWVAALESGKYRKGRGELHPTSNTFCCLGVLCAIAPKKLEVEMEPRDGRGVLPPTVSNWAGLKSYNPDLPAVVEFVSRTGFPRSEKNLANINDKSRLCFKQIAKLIRKHYKEL